MVMIAKHQWQNSEDANFEYSVTRLVPNTLQAYKEKQTNKGNKHIAFGIEREKTRIQRFSSNLFFLRFLCLY